MLMSARSLSALICVVLLTACAGHADAQDKQDAEEGKLDLTIKNIVERMKADGATEKEIRETIQQLEDFRGLKAALKDGEEKEKTLRDALQREKDLRQQMKDFERLTLYMAAAIGILALIVCLLILWRFVWPKENDEYLTKNVR